MNPDPASLDNLRDIVEPAPVSWWPPAVGWWVLLGLVVVTLAVVVALAWRKWRAGAYRRAALRQLESATDVAAIAETLKRTALAAFPRIDVAALSGPAWCRWLAETGGQQVPAPVAQALTRGVFGEKGAGNTAEVRAFAAQWIQHHGTPANDGPGDKQRS
jgi:hypothetical protein